MWAVCITSINHVLKLNGYGRRQAKVNGKRLRFKGWETLVTHNTFLRKTRQRYEFRPIDFVYLQYGKCRKNLSVEFVLFFPI